MCLPPCKARPGEQTSSASENSYRMNSELCGPSVGAECGISREILQHQFGLWASYEATRRCGRDGAARDSLARVVNVAAGFDICRDRSDYRTISARSTFAQQQEQRSTTEHERAKLNRWRGQVFAHDQRCWMAPRHNAIELLIGNRPGKREVHPNPLLAALPGLPGPRIL